MSYGRFFGAAFLLVGLCWVSVARAQTDEMKPFKDSVGKWKAEIKMWGEGPDGPPMTSTGNETNEMLGDNWLVSKFQGEFGGQAFVGMGIIGYDTEKKKYVNHWIDSMSPTMTNFEGTYDESTKTFTMLGKDQMGEGKHVTQVKDAKTRVFTMFAKPDGATEFMKVMEITYTRE